MTWQVNRLAMLANRVRMSFGISFHAVPHRLTNWLVSLRGKTTRTRVAFACLLAAMVVSPTLLYVLEHQDNDDLRRNNRRLMFESASDAAFWRASTAELMEERARLTGLLLDEGHALEEKGRLTVKVVATGYSSSIWETDMTPFITAANTPTRHGVLALSRDLLTRYTDGAPFKYGDVVHVSGVGDFIVEDTMNARWTNRIDVWFPTRLDALRFGVRQAYISRALEEEPEVDELSENNSVSAAASGGL